MKRILYLSRGGQVCGSQRQIYYVVTNLDRTRYEPIVVCPNGGQFVDQLRNHGITTHVFPLRSWRKFPACAYRYLDAERLCMFARRHEVALVHSSDLWLNGYLIWVAERLKVPSVLHVRTPIRPDEVRKHRCIRATSIIAISQRVKRNLLSAGIGPEKIVQIDDAVDLEVFRPQGFPADVLRRDFSPTGQVLVGVVGRIDPLKRQLAFVQAAERITSDFKRNVTFFVVGEIRSRSYFEKISRFVGKNGLKRRVFFTGRRSDIAEVLSSLDILVSLSGGSVMFEGMACGKPVVSAGFSSNEDSLHIQNGRTGFLVTSGGISELVEVLIRLIDNEELRKQIGKQGRKWAENKLSHVGIVTKTQCLYEQLLQS